jgi:hypothetical protein
LKGFNIVLGNNSGSQTGTLTPPHQPIKFQSVIAIFAAFVATSVAMEQPSFHTKGVPTGKPIGPLKPGEYWWKPGLSPRGPVVVLG